MPTSHRHHPSHRLGSAVRRHRVLSAAVSASVVVAGSALAFATTLSTADAANTDPVKATDASRSGGASINRWGDLSLWSDRSTGTLSVLAPAAGSVLGLHGHSSPCAPLAIVAVWIDGKADGSVTLPAGRGDVRVAFAGAFTAGRHTVTLRLTNDAQAHGCDTNAYIRDVWAAAPAPGKSPTGRPSSSVSGKPTPKPSSSTTTPSPTSGSTTASTGPAVLPDSTNTGVRAGIRLTPVGVGQSIVATNGTKYVMGANHVIWISGSGLSFSGYDIAGRVVVAGNGDTLSDCVIRGSDLGAVNSGVTNVGLYTSLGQHNLLAYSRLRPDAYFHGVNGVHVDTRWIGAAGGGFTADHDDISKAVDLVQTNGRNITVSNSYLHDNTQQPAGEDEWLNYAFNRHYAGNPSHSDGWQIEGGSNLLLINSRIVNAPWTGVIATQNDSVTTNLTINHDWLSGGACTINLHDNKNRGAFRGVLIENSVFGGNTAPSKDCQIVAQLKSYPGITLRNNVSTLGYDVSIRQMDDSRNVALPKPPGVK